MKRHANLISRQEKLEIEVNSLDDDVQLSLSPTRVLDNISCVAQSSQRQLESQRLTPVYQKTEENNMAVENPASDVSPPVPPRPAKPSFFIPQENKPNLLSKFTQSKTQFAQDTRDMTEESVKKFNDR